jgi:hypothetical protein
MNKKRWLVVIALLLLITSCDTMATPNQKASSLLLSQIELRQQQIASPTAERLQQMKNMGLNVEDLDIQRIFIYLGEPITPAQVQELQAIGITLYLDSWIPPAGEHGEGFLLADMPIDRLAELAAKDYVLRLDSAERVARPQ